jgi:hypothetical protein
MNKYDDAPKGSIGIRIIFVFFGIASLLGWNALITEIPFFLHYVPGIKPDVSMSFLNYAPNIIFQLILLCKKDLIPLKIQLIIGIVGSIVFLIIIPLFTMHLGIDTFKNKFLTCLFVIFFGFINALCSGGFFSLMTHFPLEMIVSLSSGQGFSGITMNILQFIVLASIKGEDEKAIVKRAWVFFAVSAFILVVCLVLLLISFNRDYFQYYLTKTDKKPEPAGPNVTTANSEEDLRNDKSTVAIDQGQNQNNLSKIEKSTQIVPVEQNEANIKKSNEKTQLTFCELFHRLWDLDFIILLVYAVTFALFPYATINQKLFSLNYNYSSNTIITIYNAFDTIGRYIVELFTPTKRKNIINAFSRCSLIFFIIFNFYAQDGLGWNIKLTSILIILFTLLLGLTNGIGVTLCFGLAPNEIPEPQFKGQAGSSISFFLIVGICVGACIAFGTEAIIGTFRKT